MTNRYIARGKRIGSKAKRNVNLLSLGPCESFLPSWPKPIFCVNWLHILMASTPHGKRPYFARKIDSGQEERKLWHGPRQQTMLPFRSNPISFPSNYVTILSFSALHIQFHLVSIMNFTEWPSLHDVKTLGIDSMDYTNNIQRCTRVGAPKLSSTPHIKRP